MSSLEDCCLHVCGPLHRGAQAPVARPFAIVGDRRRAYQRRPIIGRLLDCRPCHCSMLRGNLVNPLTSLADVVSHLRTPSSFNQNQATAAQSGTRWITSPVACSVFLRDKKRMRLTALPSSLQTSTWTSCCLATKTRGQQRPRPRSWPQRGCIQCPIHPGKRTSRYCIETIAPPCP